MKTFVDPITYIRNSPQRFLQQVPATGHELAAALACNALLLTGAPTVLSRFQGVWWVVGCEVDWLREAESEGDAKSAFSKILPLRAAGPNSMRAEVLIKAFAATAVTVWQGGRHTLAGAVLDSDRIWDLLADHPTWRRAVAFKVEVEAES